MIRCDQENFPGTEDDQDERHDQRLVLGDPNNNFIYISIRDDDKEKSVEIDVHEADPLRNASGNNEVITIADTRYIQIWFERKVDLMSCKEISISSVLP